MLSIEETNKGWNRVESSEEARSIKKRVTEKYSYGILLFTGEEEARRYLIIQNRDTEAFIYFFLAWNMEKWNDAYMVKVVRNFSRDELNRLLFYPFDILYTDLYVNHKKGTFQKQYDRAQSNYHYFHSRSDWIKICLNIQTMEIRWGFSKGRIEEDENPERCAVRELEEETGIKASQFQIHTDLHCPPLYYQNEKPFLKTVVHVQLFPGRATNEVPIVYQKFDNTIRCMSVSNEVLHARWISIEDAILFLPPTLYRILYEFHISSLV